MLSSASCVLGTWAKPSTTDLFIYVSIGLYLYLSFYLSSITFPASYHHDPQKHSSSFSVVVERKSAGTVEVGMASDEN